MCGIVAILNVKGQTQELRQKALGMSQKIRHRGPDWSGIYCGGSAVLAHERLSIIDPESGGQPSIRPTGNKYWPLMARYITIRKYAVDISVSMSFKRVATAR